MIISIHNGEPAPIRHQPGLQLSLPPQSKPDDSNHTDADSIRKHTIK